MAPQIIEAEVNVLPPFQPNEYLLKTHRDKIPEGEEDWKIFAWACRDVMAKVGKYGKHDIDFAERIKVYEFLTNKADTFELTEEEKKANLAKKKNE